MSEWTGRGNSNFIGVSSAEHWKQAAILINQKFSCAAFFIVQSPFPRGDLALHSRNKILCMMHFFWKFSLHDRHEHTAPSCGRCGWYHRVLSSHKTERKERWKAYQSKDRSGCTCADQADRSRANGNRRWLKRSWHDHASVLPREGGLIAASAVHLYLPPILWPILTNSK